MVIFISKERILYNARLWGMEHLLNVMVTMLYVDVQFVSEY